MTSPPKYQQGLWEIRGQSTENHGAKRTEFYFKLCRDHKYDKAQLAGAQDRKDCVTHIGKAGPNKFTSSSICRILGMAIASQGVTTYPSNTSVHSETQATYAPPINDKAEETIVQDQKYLGACPRGMKAGDLIGADGLIRHQN